MLALFTILVKNYDGYLSNDGFFNGPATRIRLCVSNALQIDKLLILHSLGQNEPSWNAFEAFIKISRFQSTQDNRSVLVFLLIKRQHDECNVRNMRQFLFGMNPGLPAFKVYGCTCDLKILNWSKWMLVLDILTQILLTLLTYTLILWRASICAGWFFFGVSYYSILYT